MNQDIDKEIRRRISKKLKKIDQVDDTEIERELEKSIDEEITEDLRIKAKESVDQEVGFPEKPEQFHARTLASDFLNRFDNCWLSGSCKKILLVMIASYILAGFSILLCLVSRAPLCLSQTVLGGVNYFIIIAILSFISVIFISFTSKNRISSIIFGILLEIPMIILLFTAIIQVIALIIVALAILSLIIRRR